MCLNSQSQHFWIELIVWFVHTQTIIVVLMGGGLLGFRGVHQIKGVLYNLIFVKCANKNGQKLAFFSQGGKVSHNLGRCLDC